jgi:CHASE2 domain-containing sensor protein
MKKFFDKNKRLFLKSFIYLLIFHFLDFCLTKTFELPALQVFSIQNLVSSDFSYNDLFYRAQNKTGFKDFKRKHKEEIILVNTASLDGEEFRLRLVELVDSLQKHKPKVIGVDFTFSTDTSIIGTSELLEMSSLYSNMVFAKSSEPNRIKLPKNVVLGNVEFPAEQFSMRHYYTDNQTFASKLFAKLRKKNPPLPSSESGTFPILYTSIHNGVVDYDDKMNTEYDVNFKSIDGATLIENPSLFSSAIKNNIIIVGHLGRNKFDVEDCFPVPTDTNDVVNRLPVMHGPVIHANALSNMLDNQFFSSPNSLISVLLTNFIMFVLIFLIIQHPMKIYLIAGLVLISLFWIWFSLYLMEYKMYIQVGSTLVGLLILEEFIEVFDPFVVRIYNKVKKIYLNFKK